MSGYARVNVEYVWIPYARVDALAPRATEPPRGRARGRIRRQLRFNVSNKGQPLGRKN